jgi:hypothetical protein
MRALLFNSLATCSNVLREHHHFGPVPKHFNQFILIEQALLNAHYSSTRDGSRCVATIHGEQSDSRTGDAILYEPHSYLP